MARKANAHDFKRAKKRVLKNYARRHALRPGSKGYNAYVHGSVAKRMVAKKRRAR